MSSLYANIPKAYIPLFKQEYRYYVYYGGRGGGKSENIAQCLIIMATQQKLRILCGREIQGSIKESVKSMLESWIEKLDLSDVFITKNQTIICKLNGSEFIFLGFSKLKATQIKSISNIDITWFEEADVMSERSYELIIPSVMRKPKSFCIVSFNPHLESDVIYKNFILEKPPKDSFVCKVNDVDNPFFEKSGLKYERDNDLERVKLGYITQDFYNWKWKGEILRQVKGALFKDDTINAMANNNIFRRGDYTRLIIAVDPATTHKEHSNKFGIITAGLHKSGIMVILEDSSDIMSPLEFAIKVETLYNAYNADCIVVETNAGGDFLSYTLLSHNPKLQIREVRAIKDKVNRAMPIANLCDIGKIKFLTSHKDFSNLTRQMRLMNSQGFLGAKGESPDSVDALVWAGFDLFNLGETQETLLLLEWFNIDKTYLILESAKNCLIATNHKQCVALKYDIVSNTKTQKKILIKDYAIYENANIKELLEYAKGYNLICPDIPLFENAECSFYDNSKINLYELTMANLAYFRENLVMLSPDLPNRSFENRQGNLLKIAISRFNEKDLDNIFVKALNELILYNL